MQDSLWTAPLAALRDRVAGSEPVPAGVSVASVTATLGLGLLTKVLAVSGKRKDFPGDPQRLAAIIQAAQRESANLQRATDEDVAAFNRYMDCLRLPKATETQRAQRDQALDAALRYAIEVPLNAVRSAAAGLDLCAEAAALIHAFVAADLGAAATLLAAAIRSMLLSVDFNAGQVRYDQAYRERITAESRQFHDRALDQSEAVRRRVREIIAA